MNSQLIQTFITFVESKNIVDAADKLHISQPAVTVHLRQLEEHLQKKLFVMQGRKKALSHFGHVFYESVQAPWRELQRSVETAHWVAGDKSQFHLRIGGRQEVLSLVAGKIEFDGKLELIPLSGKDAIAKILDRSIDLALVQNRPDTTEVVAKKVFANNVVFACHPKFLNGTSLKTKMHDLEWLKKTPSLAYKKTRTPFLTEWWDSHKLEESECNVKLVCEDWNALANLAEQGRGYSIIPDTIPLSKNVSIEKISEIKPIEFYMLYQKDLAKVLNLKDLL